MTDKPEDYVRVIGAWVEEQERKGARGDGRKDRQAVVFIALKEHVAEALRAGYSQRTIWEHLRATERIKTSYQTFSDHVRRYLPELASKSRRRGRIGAVREEGRAQGELRTTGADGTSRKGGGSQQERKRSPLDGFTMNSTPKKEDLV